MHNPNYARRRYPLLGEITLLDGRINDLLPNPEDGQIAPGVFAAYAWAGAPIEGNLIRIYIGSAEAGPVLQYDASGRDLWDGRERRDFPGGAWTPIYSRGDFGKCPSHGGHWSGHCATLHPAIVRDWESRDKSEDLLVCEDALISVPEGMGMGDINLTEIDCTGSWPIWYPTAFIAHRHRLSYVQIAAAKLPQKTRDHLLATYQSVEAVARAIVDCGV